MVADDKSFVTVFVDVLLVAPELVVVEGVVDEGVVLDGVVEGVAAFSSAATTLLPTTSSQIFGILSHSSL